MKVITFGEEKAPYISSFEEFFEVPHLLKVLNTEYCYSEVFDENIIDLACYNAYFPMSDKIAADKWALILRLHKERCIIDFSNFKVSKKIKKLASKYTLTFNKDFDKCIEMINNRYDDSWLSKPLINCFKTMRDSPNKYSTQFCSFELWDNDETLVAGEVGFIVGSCYSSLSGFHTISNTGHIQLYLSSIFLKDNGFSFWDMGMELDYKIKLGGKVLNEFDFFDKYKNTRDIDLNFKSLEKTVLENN